MWLPTGRISTDTDHCVLEPGLWSNTTTVTEVDEITKKVREYTLGTPVILGADSDRYSSMIRGLTYCPDGITHIISLAHVAKTRLAKFHITNGNQFEVTKDDGSTRVFKSSEHVIYYYAMKTSREST
jgi:hypothetical protein